MEIKNFFNNMVKLAVAPPLNNAPIIEVSKKDMKELTSFLEDNNIKHTVANEREMSFEFQHVNFLVIENDKNDELGADGKPIDTPAWEAVLDDEQQAIADAQNNPGTKEQPVTPPSESQVMQEHVSGSTVEATERIAAKEEEISDKEGKKKGSKK